VSRSNPWRICMPDFWRQKCLRPECKIVKYTFQPVLTTKKFVFLASSIFIVPNHDEISRRNRSQIWSLAGAGVSHERFVFVSCNWCVSRWNLPKRMEKVEFGWIFKKWIRKWDLRIIFQVVEAYKKLFLEDLALEKIYHVQATSGAMGGKSSHEFHMEHANGQDEIFYCDHCQQGFNSDVKCAAFRIFRLFFAPHNNWVPINVLYFH